MCARGSKCESLYRGKILRYLKFLKMPTSDGKPFSKVAPCVYCDSQTIHSLVRTRCKCKKRKYACTVCGMINT